MIKICSNCDGHGIHTYKNEKCKKCNGTGRIKPYNYTVNIPFDMDNSQIHNNITRDLRNIFDDYTSLLQGNISIKSDKYKYYFTFIPVLDLDDINNIYNEIVN